MSLAAIHREEEWSGWGQTPDPSFVHRDTPARFIFLLKSTRQKPCTAEMLVQDLKKTFAEKDYKSVSI